MGLEDAAATAVAPGQGGGGVELHPRAGERGELRARPAVRGERAGELLVGSEGEVLELALVDDGEVVGLGTLVDGTVGMPPRGIGAPHGQGRGEQACQRHRAEQPHGGGRPKRGENGLHWGKTFGIQRPAGVRGKWRQRAPPAQGCGPA